MRERKEGKGVEVEERGGPQWGAIKLQDSQRCL